MTNPEAASSDLQSLEYTSTVLVNVSDAPSARAWLPALLLRRVSIARRRKKKKRKKIRQLQIIFCLLASKTDTVSSSVYKLAVGRVRMCITYTD